MAASLRAMNGSTMMLLLVMLAATASASAALEDQTAAAIPFLQTKPSRQFKLPANGKANHQPNPQRRTELLRGSTATASTTTTTTTDGRVLKSSKSSKKSSSNQDVDDEEETVLVMEEMPPLHYDYNETHHEAMAPVVDIETTSKEARKRKGSSSSRSSRSKGKSKGKSSRSNKSSATVPKGHMDDEDDDNADDVLPTTLPTPPTPAASSSKSKGRSKGGRGVRKGHKGPRRPGRSKGTSGGSRYYYFEASLLLEMTHHYTTDLSHLELMQLEHHVAQTYNDLTLQECDVQHRHLLEVTVEPTATSTGYIVHLQGQCEGCDPSLVHLFAHDEEVYYEPHVDDDIIMVPSITNTTSSPEMTMTMVPLTPTNMTNNTAAPEPATTGRTRQWGPNGLLQKKVKTASKQRSRLQRSQDEREDESEDEDVWLTYGLSAEARAAYGGKNRIRGRQLHGHHRHQQHQHNNNNGVNRNPEATSHGANINRDAEPVLVTDAATDRHSHTYNMDTAALPMNMEPEMHALQHAHPILMTPKLHEQVAQARKRKSSSSKGSSRSRGKGSPKSSKSKGKSTKGSSEDFSTIGEHPIRDCSNANATFTAPTQAEFVMALNAATGDLLGPTVQSAVQVAAVSCSAVEETFDTALVFQFLGPGDGTLSPEEVMLVERMILQSYNHLQATESCDLPVFREITELLLRGIAQGPSEDTFLAMFGVRGTCRGEGCSENALLLDPLDMDQRHLQSFYGAESMLDAPELRTRDGQDVSYDEGSAHVYQEQCFCPFQIEEFGPPMVSDWQEILDQTIKAAYDEGTLTAIASVLGIFEVESPEDENALDKTPAPTESPAGTEDLDSFIIVQFFGAEDSVTEREVNAIEDSMPRIYANLQENSFCDPLSRSLSKATLQTVDPGPTGDSFLLGFLWEGSCIGAGCSDEPMFFSTSTEMFIPCERNKVQGAPVIGDFENDLFQTILMLQEEEILINIESSGTAVEVVPGSTTPILSTGNMEMDEEMAADEEMPAADEEIPTDEEIMTPAPSIANVPDETLAPSVAPGTNATDASSGTTSAPTMSARSQMIADIKARYSGRTRAPTPAVVRTPTPAPQEESSSEPTAYPTWLDTDHPTYLVPWGKR